MHFHRLFVPFFFPVLPLGIALIAVGGAKLVLLGLIGVGAWFAWRGGLRRHGYAGCGARWDHRGYRGGMFEPPASPRTGPSFVPPAPPATSGPIEPSPTKEGLSAALARAAARRGGSITVSQGVIDTGASMVDVSEALDRLDRDGYVTSVHRAGVDELVYRFQEIAPPEPSAPAGPTLA